MPLEKTCELQMNQVIFVLPLNGFGWCETRVSNGAAEESGIEPPAPFGMRIVRFHFHEGEIRAAIGVVEQQGHPLHGRWAGLIVRDGGGEDFHDFTHKPTKHNVHIGNSEPVLDIGGCDVPMAEWIRFDEPETLFGWAYAAESREHLERPFPWLQQVRVGS